MSCYAIFSFRNALYSKEDKHLTYDEQCAISSSFLRSRYLTFDTNIIDDVRGHRTITNISVRNREPSERSKLSVLEKGMWWSVIDKDEGREEKTRGIFGYRVSDRSIQYAGPIKLNVDRAETIHLKHE